MSSKKERTRISWKGKYLVLEKDAHNMLAHMQEQEKVISQLKGILLMWPEWLKGQRGFTETDIQDFVAWLKDPSKEIPEGFLDS